MQKAPKLVHNSRACQALNRMTDIGIRLYLRLKMRKWGNAEKKIYILFRYYREFQTYIFFQFGKSEIGIGSFCHPKSGPSHFPTAQIPRTQECGEFGPLGRGPGFDVKYIKITTKLDT